MTTTDVIRFKDHRLTVVAPKTVKDNDLAGLKTVFGYAKTNGRIDSNPADGVTVITARKPRKLRSKGFTDAEAIAILGCVPNDRATSGPTTPEVFIPAFAARKAAPPQPASQAAFPMAPRPPLH